MRDLRPWEKAFLLLPFGSFGLMSVSVGGCRSRYSSMKMSRNIIAHVLSDQSRD